MTFPETSQWYRSLGTSGLRVSAIGLGCNNFGRRNAPTESQEGTNAVIFAALDAGVTFLDTADTYGLEPGLSETLIGNALKGKRDDVVIATKFGLDVKGANGEDWGARGSRRYIRRAVESSLTRLQTDWIDLYQLHRPDPNTPIEETVAALDELIAEGKVRYIGHSNFQGWQIADAEYTARIDGHERFVSAQNQYSLLSRGAEDEILPAVRRYGLGFLPYYPLYNGILTGKHSRAGGMADTRVTRDKPELLDQTNWDAVERFQTFCHDRGITMLQGTFSWLLAQPGLASVIAGATRPKQIVENVAAASAWSPEASDMEQISSIFS